MASPVLVQHNVNGTGGTPTLAVILAAAPATNNMLLAHIELDSAVSVTGVQDGQSHAYALIKATPGSGGMRLETWGLIAPAGLPTNYTITASFTSTYASMVCAEWSGMPASITLTTSNDTGVTTPAVGLPGTYTGPSITTTTTNDLIIALSTSNSSANPATFSVTSPFFLVDKELDGNDFGTLCVGSDPASNNPVPGPGTYACAFTMDGATGRVVVSQIIAIFQSSTAGSAALVAGATLLSGNRVILIATATNTTKQALLIAQTSPTAAAIAASIGQRIYPASDTKVGNWTNQVGATTNLWQSINSEVDTWTSPSSPFTNLDPPGISNDPFNPANNFGFNSIVVDAFTPSTVYMGTNYFGLWRSIDSGLTWNLRSTGTNSSFITTGKMWTLAIDAFNNTIYTSASTSGEEGVWKSTDGGVSWTDMFPPSNAVRIAIGNNGDVYTISTDPFIANHLICSFHSPWSGGGGTGIIESSDGGSTWVQHNPPFVWGAGAGVWFGNDSNTWIVGIQSSAGGNTDGFWITRNASSSWSKFSTNVLTHGATQALYRDPASGALVVASGTTILRSTDSGTTWVDIGTSGLPGGGLQAIACDGTTMYTAPGFPNQGTNGASANAMVQKPLAASAGTAWTSFGVQTDRLDPSGYYNGPVQAAYDATNHIIYTTNWNGGVWRLQGVRDLIQSEVRPALSQYTTHMGAMAIPGNGTRTLAFEYQKSAAGGQIDLTVDLMQSGTVLQTWTFTNVPDTMTVQQLTITASITDYTTQLDVRFTANQSA